MPQTALGEECRTPQKRKVQDTLTPVKENAPNARLLWEFPPGEECDDDDDEVGMIEQPVPELTQQQRDSLAELAAEHVKDKKGCREGRPPLVSHCKLCSRAKHSCKWCTMTDYSGRTRCTGGACYACYRACSLKYLGITRNVMAIKAVPGVLEAVQSTSRIVSASLDSDTCQCYACTSAQK